MWIRPPFAYSQILGYHINRSECRLFRIESNLKSEAYAVDMEDLRIATRFLLKSQVKVTVTYTIPNEPFER